MEILYLLPSIYTIFQNIYCNLIKKNFVNFFLLKLKHVYIIEKNHQTDREEIITKKNKKSQTKYKKKYKNHDGYRSNSTTG